MRPRRHHACQVHLPIPPSDGSMSCCCLIPPGCYATPVRSSMLSLLLQAEVQTKATTIEKNKGTVGVASRIQAALNSEGLKVNEFIAQSHQKQARLEELDKLHPELQQVFSCSAVFSICYAFL